MLGGFGSARPRRGLCPLRGESYARSWVLRWRELCSILGVPLVQPLRLPSYARWLWERSPEEGTMLPPRIELCSILGDALVYQGFQSYARWLWGCTPDDWAMLCRCFLGLRSAALCGSHPQDSVFRLLLRLVTCRCCLRRLVIPDHFCSLALSVTAR